VPAVEDEATNDRELLRAAYADSAKLADRVALYDHQEPFVDLPARVLSRLDLPAGARIVDLGCGYGRYEERLAAWPSPVEAIGVDLSEGMVREARARIEGRAHWLVADAQRVPIATGSCDAAIAAHMLYHVPDIAAAVTEARRILRPGGVLLVTTNGRAHLRPMYDLVAEVAGVPDLPGVTDRFQLSDRGVLDRVFPDVDVELVQGTVVVTDPAPVIAFVASGRDLREPLLAGATTWDELLAGVEAEVRSAIDRVGAYRLPTEVAIVTCR
jgi:SAM-dependent methyltransferase